MKQDKLKIAGKTLKSRLFIGTGKFSSGAVMKKCVISSGASIVTVAVRRIDAKLEKKFNMITFLKNMKNIIIVPNTSGARDADEAVKVARLARAMGLGNWVKLELTPQPDHLCADPVETLKAAIELVKEKFVVLPYINADPVLAKRLEDEGCAAVMPMGSFIGSNLGLITEEFLNVIIQNAKVPVVVDAGIGAPSHAAKAMEIGADAVLVNTALALSPRPEILAEAFKKSVEAGRAAYKAGLAPADFKASPSSPLTGFLFK